MADFQLEAERRAATGTGNSRRLRRQNRVPGVIYGGDKEPLAVHFDHDGLKHDLENEAFYTRVLTIKVDGAEEQVVLRDIQRHVTKPKIEHIDFIRVQAGQSVRIHAPLHFVGEDQNAAVKEKDGVVSHLANEVEVEALPKDLPEFIEVDVSGLDINESLHLSELTLPQGVSLVALSHGPEYDVAVVSIHAKAARDAGEPETEASAEDVEEGTPEGDTEEGGAEE